MAPIVIETGQSRVEQRSLSLSKAGKERILQNFPEKIAVSVPGFGAKEFPLRVLVKSFLDQVGPPVARVTFAVRADAEDMFDASIDIARLKVIGPTSGSFKAVDAEVAYAFDLDVEPGDPQTIACKCGDGRDGEQRRRAFKFIWQIEISIDPGIGGVFEIEEFEIVVETPCVCADVVEDVLEDVAIDPYDGDEAAEGDDDHDREHKRKKRKKKSKHRDD